MSEYEKTRNEALGRVSKTAVYSPFGTLTACQCYDHEGVCSAYDCGYEAGVAVNATEAAKLKQTLVDVREAANVNTVGTKSGILRVIDGAIGPPILTLKQLRIDKGLSVEEVNRAMGAAGVASNSNGQPWIDCITHWEASQCPRKMFKERIRVLAYLYGVSEETIKACPEVA